MSIIDSAVRHIKCDAPACTKEVLFDQKDKDAVFTNPENSWLKSTRVTQTADGRNFAYCSDICEVEGVKTGKHNIPEAPKVTGSASAADISAAAAMVKARADADKALREGTPTNIQITD